MANAPSANHPEAPAAAAREEHARWLLELTQVATAAGREGRVVAWITRWVAERPELELRADAAGNLVVQPREPWGQGRTGAGPVFITAHLDHPAFVVERVIGPGTCELAFRGGVMDPYFEHARVRVHPASGPAIGAALTGPGSGARSDGGAILFKTYHAELDSDAAAALRVGDVATWDLPPAEIDAEGLVHTHACDDLAALAAALAAYDTLLGLVRAGSGADVLDVRLLCTRAEEIGFVGAIAACKLGTMPKGSRVVALENSRSFADSPIGGGPIVRVGDRMSIFTPQLTAACARRAEQISNRPAQPTATQTERDLDARAALRWQRKLMSGGACEATVFCAYGYAATCLCLPLGNYHNMADLAAVQDGTWDRTANGPPRVAREFIGLSDYHGLVDLLVAIGRELPEADPALARLEALYAGRAFVLDEK